MLEIKKPVIECVSSEIDGSYSKFVVEPLQRGYGTTLGNSLRRVLLSSIVGTAITTIKIAGIQHEFSTIPGVKEDVTEIVLNVKAIRARLFAPTAKTLVIEATGPYEVRAGDIKADGEVEILNPDLLIATLSEGASLNMELTLSHGYGYVSAERNKPAQAPIGLIPIDSIFTPVTKVNYTVENTRVGKDVDLDKLTLEVWTDKTLTAQEAVAWSAKHLIDLLEEHPEGIVAYDSWMPHAILLTDYDADTDTFYCADPSEYAPYGRIPVTESLISIYDVSTVWYVTDAPEITAPVLTIEAEEIEADQQAMAMEAETE